jgi:hypothetical protein
MEEKKMNNKIGDGFEITKKEGNLIFAERKSTGKKVVIFEGELDKETELKMMTLWIREEMHPFNYKNGKFIDILFGDVLDEI